MIECSEVHGTGKALETLPCTHRMDRETVVPLIDCASHSSEQNHQIDVRKYPLLHVRPVLKVVKEIKAPHISMTLRTRSFELRRAQICLTTATTPDSVTFKSMKQAPADCHCPSYAFDIDAKSRSPQVPLRPHIQDRPSTAARIAV